MMRKSLNSLPLLHLMFQPFIPQELSTPAVDPTEGDVDNAGFVSTNELNHQPPHGDTISCPTPCASKEPSHRSNTSTLRRSERQPT